MFVFLVMEDNEFAGEKFDKKNILTYVLPTQKSLIKMRTSIDVTPGYDGNYQISIQLHKKVIFY